MKKLFLIPAFVLFMTGASSIKVEHKVRIRPETANLPLNVKVDSLYLKSQELNRLIQEL